MKKIVSIIAVVLMTGGIFMYASDGDTKKKDVKTATCHHHADGQECDGCDVPSDDRDDPRIKL